MKKHHFFIGSGIVLCAVIVVASILLYKRDVSLGYDFNEPDETFFLPDILSEVSGITLTEDRQLGCVQDEIGVLFLFDPNSEAIVSQRTFAENGDYEGVCKAGSYYYVLRSDGTLFELKDQEVVAATEIIAEEDIFETSETPVKRYNLHLPVIENEGLFFDQKNNRLLIVSREKSPRTRKNERLVYVFDLAEKRLLEHTAFTLDPFAGTWKKYRDLSFNPSELALHPITGQIFVLSSKDHALFVFSAEGNIQHIQRLNPVIFPKPEGIAFAENGYVYISNENKDEKPTVLFFKYNPGKL